MRRFGRTRTFVRATIDYLRFISSRGRDLIAGPFVGEFGFECMEWQSFVNAQVGRFENVYVITYPGRDALYPGCKLIAHDVNLAAAGYMHGRTPHSVQRKILRDEVEKLGLSSSGALLPDIFRSPFYRSRLPQRWLSFGTDVPLRFDLVFHFRSVVKSGDDTRINFPPESADRLALLCAERGLVCGVIGHPEFSYCPPGASDCRSVDLSDTINAISASRVVVGQQSGPIHLANLCPRDVIIWADAQSRIDMCLHWNPHRVRIETVSNQTFSPPPEEVVRVIENYFKSVRPERPLRR